MQLIYNYRIRNRIAYDNEYAMIIWAEYQKRREIMFSVLKPEIHTNNI
jgi:hypothetical protein